MNPKVSYYVTFALCLFFAIGARQSLAQNNAANPTDSFRLGQKLTVNGQTLYVVKKLNDGQIVLALPQPMTESLGAFIQPADVKNDPPGGGRPIMKIIDGSGLGEWFPGSGVWVHTDNVYETGNSMWNNKVPTTILTFDLGKEYNVNGAYIWNYNEAGTWTARGIRETTFSASIDGKTYNSILDFTLDRAPGAPDYRGQVVPFGKIVHTRFVQMALKDNYGGDELGLSEVRFSNADQKAAVAGEYKAKYLRPQHPRLARGQPLAGAENIVYPPDAGIIDVSQAPYNAKGDGVTDDTAALQKALEDHPNQGAIIYLPNGIYLVSKQLRWGGGEDPFAGGAQKQTILQGQSRDGTVIRLKDAAPNFEDTRNPRGVIWTGRAPAQRFGNEICNLSVDTGVDNPGATGIQFIANNQGGVRDVAIVSGDGYGHAGLDLGYTDEQGPCWIKNVKVTGFDTGVNTAYGVASVTMENITVQEQNKVGVNNGGQPLSLRGLHSRNSVSGVDNNGGLLVILDSTLEGRGADSGTPAMLNASVLLARGLRTTGYGVAIDDRTGHQVINGPDVPEFRSNAPIKLLAGADRTLNLPVQNTPELPWDDPKTWVSPLQFGAKLDDGQDDSDAIQKAIDSGVTTIYLPRGGYNVNKTIVIRGAVRRIIGCKAWLMPGPAITAVQPLFRLEDGAAPVVSLERISSDFTGERMFIEQVSHRTLVLREIEDNFRGGDAYRGSGGGTVFIEDMVGPHFSFKNQSAWARQLNPEGFGTHVTNDGGKLWVLGLKVETGGAICETRNGGKTEILGGLSQTNNGKVAPMFVNSGSDMSVTFAEVNNSDSPFLQFVSETRGAETKDLGDPSTQFRGFRPVIYEGRLTP